ncbi:DHH family phosphoesterase [Lachnoclostridium sp. An196]|uniref:DHH family phosphoesterase n=1 Tax=Lachnoclostridium sp. An196 TaxID=1965583 RepID=UPI000B392723|nr:bifunctional oligoribonuclease/PAP phosphatase NrnA [Lachnoclostridium sp. An196]OUP22516.1 DHH family phosphoesterase [Lachnoclostridium sp. An196]
MMRLEMILQNVQTVGLAGHIRPDGDSVGACVGLWNYIKDNFPQIRADIWLEQPDRKFSILEGFEMIRRPDGQDRKYDLFISLDAADLKRLGDALPYFENAKKTVCVDHHISNKGFADENVIVPDASSTCEVLFHMMEPEQISRAAATAIYMGIAHDTGVFQYSCTSPDTMRAAAVLMEKGIPYSRILEETFYKKTYLQNQVLGRALLESMLLLDGRCIVSATRKRDMEFFGVGPADLEGIVSQLKLTEGVEVAIYLYETGNHEYKVSLRSKELVDVSEIASYFGGGGHVRAAGVTMQGTFHDIVNNLTLHIERQLTEQETE